MEVILKMDSSTVFEGSDGEGCFGLTIVEADTSVLTGKTAAPVMRNEDNATLEVDNVSADPLAFDTDGDGLRDAREFELGTDPEEVDTTGDGIDDEALARQGSDPTVFKTTGPEATLRSYTQWSEVTGRDVKWYLRYTYVVEDPVGIDEFQISREGTTFDSATVTGSTWVKRTSTRESVIEGALSVLRGSTAIVETTDVYGNTRTQMIHSQTALAGRLLKDLTPFGAGRLSGASHFAAELPEFVLLLIDDPLAVYDALTEFIGNIGMDLIHAMVRSVQREQHLDNPFKDDPDSEEYQKYEAGWYTGYGALVVAETVLGLKALKGIASVAKLKSTLKTTVNGVNKVRALLDEGLVRHTAKIVRESITRHTRPHVDYSAVAGKLGNRRFSAGKIIDGINRLDVVDARHLRALSMDEQVRLATRLSESTNPGKVLDLVNELADGSSVRRLLDEDVNVDQLAKNYDGLSGSHRKQFVRYLENDELGQSWARVVGNERINTEAVKRALVRINDEIDGKHSIDRFRTAREVNSEFTDDYADPFRDGTIVVDYTTETTERFVRMHKRGEAPGQWIMRYDEVEGLSPKEIQQKFSLPETYKFMSDVDVPVDTKMRLGEVEANFGGRAGATQFQLRERIPKDSFKNERRIDDDE